MFNKNLNYPPPALFSGVHMSSINLMPRMVACRMRVFFQEVMIISRKNSRVHAGGEGAIFVTIVRGWRERSRRCSCNSHVVAFCPGSVVSCLCVAVIQIKSIHSGHCLYCDFGLWKQFCTIIFTVKGI